MTYTYCTQTQMGNKQTAKAKTCTEQMLEIRCGLSSSAPTIRTCLKWNFNVKQFARIRCGCNVLSIISDPTARCSATEDANRENARNVRKTSSTKSHMQSALSQKHRVRTAKYTRNTGRRCPVKFRMEWVLKLNCIDRESHVWRKIVENFTLFVCLEWVIMSSVGRKLG